MTNFNSKVYIGIDIGKFSLDVFISGVNKYLKLENNNKGHNILLKNINKYQIEMICMEATGGYEKTILKILSEAKAPVARVNAKWVRDFAKAKGHLAKTDKIDAKVIAEYAEKMTPAPYQKVDEIRSQLRDLFMRRQQVVQMLVAEKNRLEKVTNKIIQSSIKKIIKHLEQEIEKLGKDISTKMAGDSCLTKQIQAITAIKGVGNVTATALVSLLPELGSLDRQQIGALAGLAPVNRDSGTFKGKRFIKGGRHAIRSAMYMGTLAATRTNPIIKKIYDRHLAAGKLKKVAITACMRKILIYVNTTIKDLTYA